MTRKLFYSLFFILIVSPTFSQNYWKTFLKSDGLISSKVNELSIAKNHIYLATDSGLSVYDFNGFVNYDTSNSQIRSNVIRKIRSHGDTTWMVNDSGLCQFVNGNFTHFDTSNGLLTNVIQDIEVDQNGTLWIASFDGLTKKEGAIFTHFTGRKIYDIAINSGDSIYGNVFSESIVNIANPVTAELFDGNNWTTIRDTGLKTYVGDAKLIQMNNGEIGITSNNSGAYLINGLFDLDSFEIPANSINVTKLTAMDIGSNGDYWFSFTGAGQLDKAGLYRFDGANYTLYQEGFVSSKINQVKCANGKVIIATDEGFAIANDSVQAIPAAMQIETSSISARFNSYGGIFTNSPSTSYGFNYPKGSDRTLIYDGSIWMSSSNDSGKLAKAGYVEGDFSAGPVSSNPNLIRKNMHYITKAAISQHLSQVHSPGYVVPDVIRDWPANGRSEFGEFPDQAPFIDINSNGCYDPENGDFPFIIGDKAIYIITNDAKNTVHGLTGNNLNVEVHTLVHVFDQPNVPYLDQAVFVRQSIVNRNAFQLDSIRVGLNMDIDIGNPIDDAHGSLPSADIFFAYNGDDFDETFVTQPNINLGTKTPAIGAKFINHSMSSYIGYSDFNGLLAAPFTPGHYYRALKGLWNDGNPITTGGNGYNPSQMNTASFLFPGRLDKANEWSLINPGPAYPANNLGDARSVGVFAPFDLKSGERKNLDYLVAVAFDSNMTHLEQVSLLTDELNKAAQFQAKLVRELPDPDYSNCITGIIEEAKTEKFQYSSIFPNPSSGILFYNSFIPVEGIRIIDMLGNDVAYWSVQMQLNGEFQLPEHLSNGIYFLNVELQNGNQEIKKIILSR